MFFIAIEMFNHSIRVIGEFAPGNPVCYGKGMKEKTFLVLNVALTLSGVLFSGYMSAVKFMTSNCAFDEPCPLFLGYPACYFGFGLFLALLLTSLLTWAHILRLQYARFLLRFISLSGALFAGYFVAQELLRYRAAGFQHGTLVVPTCTYGFIFFLIIFGLSFKQTLKAES